MDAKAALDSVLADGQAMASGTLGQAWDKAEQHLDVPDAGPERDAMISGMKTGAVAAGALAILLGTRAGRRLGGTALKLGSVAAVGGLAYKAWQRWEKNVQGGRVRTVEPADFSIDTHDEKTAQERSLALLRAMIAAAQADGHVDAQEKQTIMQKMGNQKLEASVLEFLRNEIENPPTVETLASLATSETVAAEMYLAASVVIDQTNGAENQWLESLRQSLKIKPDLVAEMEKEIA